MYSINSNINSQLINNNQLFNPLASSTGGKRGFFFLKYFFKCKQNANYKKASLKGSITAKIFEKRDKNIFKNA